MTLLSTIPTLTKSFARLISLQEATLQVPVPVDEPAAAQQVCETQPEEAKQQENLDQEVDPAPASASPDDPFGRVLRALQTRDNTKVLEPKSKSRMKRPASGPSSPSKVKKAMKASESKNAPSSKVKKAPSSKVKKAMKAPESKNRTAKTKNAAASKAKLQKQVGKGGKRLSKTPKSSTSKKRSKQKMTRECVYSRAYHAMKRLVANVNQISYIIQYYFL